MADTVRDLIKDALCDLTYISANDTVEGEDSDLALRYLQGMVDLLQGDRLMLWTATRVSLLLIANQATLTVGATGGDRVGTRPMWVTRPMVTPVGETSEYQVVPYNSLEDYLAEPVKTLTNAWPLRLLYQRSTPILGKFTFWPVPTTACSLSYGLPTPLTQPLTVNTDLAFPPGGYRELYRLLLAKRLARPFSTPVPADLKEDIDKAESIVLRLNDEGPPIYTSDLAEPTNYNIFTNRTNP